MAPVPKDVPKDVARKAIKKSRQLGRILQGNMGLEGQGLGKETLRELHKDNRRYLIDKYKSSGAS